MQAAQQLAESIVNATALIHQPGSSQEQRLQAVQFFEQVGALVAGSQRLQYASCVWGGEPWRSGRADLA